MYEAIRPELARLQIRMPPEDFVTAYMCLRMGPTGSWFCKGLSHSAVSSLRPANVMSASERYFGWRVVSSDEVSARLERCPSCPKSGVCTCAGAYESAVCSVAYGPDARVWLGTPKTCWRLG